MNDLCMAIRKQVESCSELLLVFQSERRLYSEKKTVGIDEITQILERKKELVEIFDRQHLLVKQLRESADDSCNEVEQSKRKELIRKLSSIIEQLLVIDHENEKLLRDSMSCRKVEVQSAPAATRTASSERLRPALQRQLPFVPGMRNSASVAFVPTSLQSASSTPKPAAPENSRTEKEATGPAARHLLKKYTRSITTLDSKYA